MKTKPFALAGALTLSFALTACGGGDTAEDTTTDDLGTLEADGFSMDFPEDRDAQEQSAAGLQFTMHTAELSDDEAFVAALVDVPDGQPLSLEGALQGGAANVNGTVEASEEVEVDGRPALEGRFSAEQGGETGTGWGVVADVDGSLFQFMYITEGADDDTEPPAILDDMVASIVFD